MKRIVQYAIFIFPMALYANVWEATDGPPSNTLCLVANSKGYVFCGTPNSAVYRTTDKGNTWTRQDRGIDDGGPNFVLVHSLTITPDDVLYAGVSSTGVLRSTDDGETWHKLDLGMEVERNALIYVSVEKLSNGKTAIFVGHSGPSKAVMRYSDDDGVTFREIPRSNIPSAMNSIENVFLSPNSERMFVMVTYNLGLYRSDNYGQTWRRIDSDPVSGESDDLYTMIVADRNGTLFLGRNALPNSRRFENTCILRSTNDGESWEYKIAGWDSRYFINNRIRGIAIGPGQDVWAITSFGSGVFYSSNSGETWVSRNEGLPNDGSGFGVAVTPDNTVFVGQNGDHVYRYFAVSSVVDDVPQMLQLQNVQVSPNPVRDRVFLTIETQASGSATIQLMDITGSPVVDPFVKNFTEGKHQVSLNTEMLPAGMYVWSVTTQTQMQSGTVCVLR